MPLYEYECGACGHRFERIQKFSDPPLETCPRCGGALRKLQSAPAFHLKGSGWYITDYARKEDTREDKREDKKGEQKEDQKAEKTDAAKSSTEKPTETKTESTTEKASPSTSSSKES